MEYFGYIVAGIVGAWIGWRTRGAIMLYHLSENPEQVIDSLKKIQKINEAEQAGFNSEDAVKIAEGVKVRAEVINSNVYLFGLDDNQFIAQGSSIEDAFLVAKSRFPGKSFWLEKQHISNQTA
jgi:hypothetical protein